MTKEEKFIHALQQIFSIARSTEEKYVLGCTVECAINKIKKIAEGVLSPMEEEEYEHH